MCFIWGCFWRWAAYDGIRGAGTEGKTGDQRRTGDRDGNKGREKMTEEIWSVWTDYMGSGWHLPLFLAALLYLLVTEKEKRVRVVLLEASVVLLALFVLPPFYRLMDALDAGTYYRILWLLPTSAVIAWAGVRLVGRQKHRIAAFALLAALLILMGTCVYRNPNVSRAQNRFHLPNAVIAICDAIMPAEDEERVWAVFPEELIHYVRQYSSRIQMPYGRDMLESTWVWNAVKHPIYLEMCKEVVDVDALAPLLTEYGCQYLIFNRSKETAGEFGENGLTLIAQIEDYDVYRNEAVPVQKKAASAMARGLIPLSLPEPEQVGLVSPPGRVSGRAGFISPSGRT